MSLHGCDSDTLSETGIKWQVELEDKLDKSETERSVTVVTMKRRKLLWALLITNTWVNIMFFCSDFKPKRPSRLTSNILPRATSTARLIIFHINLLFNTNTS